jgi:GT2 family glycosyltransferase
MSVSVDTFRFLLPYESLFGGAIAVPARIFRAVNGFSNAFFGWGGEDDDFSLNRLWPNGYGIARFDAAVSRYLMLPHAKQPKEKSNEDRLRNGALDAATEGLSNLEYQVMDYLELPLYTKITVLL